MMIWTFTLNILVAMATPSVAMELNITRHFAGGFQSDFCYTLTNYVHGWTAHLIFEEPVDHLDMYRAEVTQTLNSGKEFVIKNLPYDGNLEAGQDLCLKFTARTSSTILLRVFFYLNGVDNPAHTTPETTSDPQLARAHVLWQLRTIPSTERDPMGPFHVQSEGQFNEGSLSIADDPAGLPGKVLRVYYQKGHYISIHDTRGAQFYSRPTAASTSLTLSYDIYFNPGFDFVKGGKLPGLFGGATNCSGGRHSDACFSTRLMWRTHGDGEVYAYIPVEQDPALCHDQSNTCNPTYGASLARGSWRFKVGEWQNIAQHVTLNTPGHLNGKVKVWFNGNLVLEMNNINFRKTENIQVEGLFFSTFFGGSDPSWAPTSDCYTYYKHFVISTDENHPAIIG